MKPFYENRFNSIQMLRGLAAIFVIFEHVRFLNCGAFGVDIFFCISGFMIMLSTEKNTEHFLAKRAIRILPLYSLMTLGTFALLLVFPSMFETTKADGIALLKSLFFIPFDIGGGVLQPILRVGWTVYYEIFFYLLFFIAFHISHKYRGLLCSMFLMVLVTMVHLFDPANLFLRFYGDPVALEFIYGICAYYICKKIYVLKENGKLPGFLSYVSLLIGLVTFAVLAITKVHANILGFMRPMIWGLPATLIVICFFIAGVQITSPKILTTIGNMSFSIYLIHYYPVLFLDRKVFDFSTCRPTSVLGVAICVAICLGLSYIRYLLIEKKLSKKVSDLFLRKSK